MLHLRIGQCGWLPASEAGAAQRAQKTAGGLQWENLGGEDDGFAPGMCNLQHMTCAVCNTYFNIFQLSGVLLTPVGVTLRSLSTPIPESKQHCPSCKMGDLVVSSCSVCLAFFGMSRSELRNSLCPKAGLGLGPPKAGYQGFHFSAISRLDACFANCGDIEGVQKSPTARDARLALRSSGQKQEASSFLRTNLHGPNREGGLISCRAEVGASSYGIYCLPSKAPWQPQAIADPKAGAYMRGMEIGEPSKTWPNSSQRIASFQIFGCLGQSLAGVDGSCTHAACFQCSPSLWHDSTCVSACLERERR